MPEVTVEDRAAADEVGSFLIRFLSEKSINEVQVFIAEHFAVHRERAEASARQAERAACVATIRVKARLLEIDGAECRKVHNFDRRDKLIGQMEALDQLADELEGKDGAG